MNLGSLTWAHCYRAVDSKQKYLWCMHEGKYLPNFSIFTQLQSLNKNYLFYWIRLSMWTACRLVSIHVLQREKISNIFPSIYSSSISWGDHWCYQASSELLWNLDCIILICHCPLPRIFSNTLETFHSHRKPNLGLGVLISSRNYLILANYWLDAFSLLEASELHRTCQHQVASQACILAWTSCCSVILEQ